MKKEELEKIKDKYESLISIKSEINKLKVEKEKLEYIPEVKRYLQIIEILENDRGYSFYGCETKSDDELLETAINVVKPTNTNNIYVYIGTYQKNTESDVEHGSNDYKVNYLESSADYSLYRNIESGDYEIVSIKQREDFEIQNIVIKPPKTVLNEQYYYKIRNLYFIKAVEDGPEKALEKMLYKRNLFNGRFDKNNLK